VGVLLVAVGCDLDGLTGNPTPDGGAVDGGGPLPDGGGVGGDAGAGGDAARSPCVGGPQRYCDDFDDRTTPGSSLWTADARNGGAIVIDKLDAVSRPSSLLATLDAPDPNPGGAHLTATVPLPGNKARVEMQVRLTTDSLAPAQACRFFQISGGGVFAFELGAGAVSLHMVVPRAGQPPLDQLVALAPFPLQRWVKLVAEVTFDAAAGAVFVSADGKTLYDMKGITTQGPGASASFAVAIGADGIGRCSARFDDVLVF